MNLTQITSKLSPRGWLAVGGSAAAILLFGYLLMSMASAPSYTTLMAGVDPTQTGKITSALSTAGIPYQIQNNGTAIAVQTSKEAQARVALASGGLLASEGGSNALSSFNSSSGLGESEFQQNVRYQSALEQQLDSTIENIQGISSAQVQLVLPDSTDQLFSSSTQSASAAVLLSDTGSLDPGSVKGVADLVAGSVPGLSDTKVTITDQTGALLWPSSASGADGAMLSKQSAEASYDSATAAQVDAMLAQTLGPGKAVVQINADLNTNQTTNDSLTYAKKGVPLSTDTTTEKLTGGSGSTGGVTGANVTSYAAGTGSGASKYNNVTSQVNYGVSKTVTHEVVSPGAINRQTVAVLVASSVPKSDLSAIKQTVTSAVGLNPTRGDTISVNQIPFAKAVTPAASSSPTQMIGYAKYALVGLGALMFLLFTGRMLRRRENEAFAGQPTWLRELEAPRTLASIEAEQAEPSRVAQLRPPVNVARQQVEDLVERDADRVASQVRQWMAED